MYQKLHDLKKKSWGRGPGPRRHLLCVRHWICDHLFVPAGQPDKVPEPLNYTHFVDTRNVRFSYHSVTLPHRDSGLHVEVVPHNPDDKYLVSVVYEPFPVVSEFDTRRGSRILVGGGPAQELESDPLVQGYS